MKKAEDSSIITIVATLALVLILAFFTWKAATNHLRDRFKGMIFYFVDSLDVATDEQMKNRNEKDNQMKAPSNDAK